MAFTYASDGIFIYGVMRDKKPGKFIEVNDKGCLITGYTREELLNLTPLEVDETPPDFANKVMQKLFQDKHIIFETILVTKNGNRIPIEISNYLITEKEEYFIVSIIREITKRKLAEEEGRKVKERYQRIVEDLPDLICRYKPDTTITFVNNAYAKYFNKSEEELVGTSFLELIPPEAHDYVRNSIASLNEDSPVVSMEHEVLTPDGQRKWQLWRDRPLFDSSGNITEIQSIGKDITERKLAEKEALAEKMKLENIVEGISAGLTTLDTKARVIWANDIFQDWFGPLKDIEGTYCHELFQLKEPEKECAALRAMRSGKVESGKSFAYTVRDVEKYFQLTTAPVKDIDGRIVQLVELVQDITELKRIEKDLAERERQYRNLFSSIRDVIVIADINRNIIDANQPALREHFGYELEEITGKKASVLYASEEKFKETGKEVFNSRKKPIWKIMEVEYRKKNGDIFPSELYASKLLDEKGEVIGNLGIVRDITERKLAEEQLKASLREKEVLLREIHHRVKNNMQVISSLLMFQGKYYKDKRYAEILREGQRRIRSMSLVHERLYQSKDLANVNFGDYIKNVADDLFKSYEIHKGRITLDIDVKDVTIGVDMAIPCGLIVNELISNSLKHAFPDERRGKIRIAFRSFGKDEFELTVGDNGAGFPEDLDFRGTGTMGMHLVNILAKQLRSEIELNRTEGTEFRIRFKEKIQTKEYRHGKSTNHDR
jgi:PAS domain S-box-containing protein